MKKLIDVLLIKNPSLFVFRMAFRWYNEIYSRKIELSDDDLNRIFERIHTKAIEMYNGKIWGTLETDDNKFWYSESPDKESAFPLVPVLINYGNAILQDGFSEVAYPNEPEKATVEYYLFFIYSYVRSMKSTENVAALLPPELIPSAIDPIVNHLIVHEKDMGNFNSLTVNLLIDILSLNNKLNQANRLEGLYNQPALNKIWGGKKDDTIVGVIMLDGDNFKHVNDSCGHNVGDEVLEVYRDSILNAIELSGLKARTFPSRWGGEEFCVCVFDSNEKEIIDLSKKINSELNSHKKWEELKRREQKGKVDFPRTFSQGIALGKKSDFIYLNALVKIADKQVYMAKENGRNCIYYDSKVLA